MASEGCVLIVSPHVRGTTESVLGVTSCCGSCLSVFVWLSSSIPSGSNMGLIPHIVLKVVLIPTAARAGS